MGKMSELDYEQRMAAEPKFSETYCSQCGQNLGPGDSGVSHCKDHLVCLTNTHQQLDAALEYERIGRILGTYGGRLVFIPDNRATVWPEGTAVYVRRVKK